jgi:hypothetical protein
LWRRRDARRYVDGTVGWVEQSDTHHLLPHRTVDFAEFIIGPYQFQPLGRNSEAPFLSLTPRLPA